MKRKVLCLALDFFLSLQFRDKEGERERVFFLYQCDGVMKG